MKRSRIFLSLSAAVLAVAAFAAKSAHRNPIVPWYSISSRGCTVSLPADSYTLNQTGVAATVFTGTFHHQLYTKPVDCGRPLYIGE